MKFQKYFFTTRVFLFNTFYRQHKIVEYANILIVSKRYHFSRNTQMLQSYDI